MVFKAMDRRQVSLFKKMLGKAFDLDSITQGFFRGGPGGPGGRRNGANGNANGNGNTAGTTNQAANGSTAPATPAATTNSGADATTTTKPAATPRRQSLRERRGLSGQQSSPDGQ